VVDAFEEELRRSARAGELRGAFERALARYGPELLGFLDALVGHEEEARELYAQLCEDLWRAFPEFEWRATFRTWAYVAARNAVRRHRASAGRRRLRPLTSQTLEGLEARLRTETAPHLKTDNKARVSRLRERLDPDDRMLLILRVDRALAWEDIAAILDDRAHDEGARKRAAASMRKRFERLKERLRALAREEGLLSDE
jgi:RNA polymerase sigma-70 factor, ECF subfamily